MSTALTFTTGRHTDGAVVLAATGEIDMSNADAFAAALTGARKQAAQAPIIVDLTAVEYLDSAGLAALFPHIEQVTLLASPLLAPVLTVAGLADLTTVRDAQ
ncbi:anti-anti-sigma factor [Actinoplanes tereljensis]|uniref:Anti-anti-sigma factor n=1 Tax=Paractinoplanes tereljensis TaxID=571912 RepID=A0A919TVA9_9ACTN|nr:STAS domain-containing protein [Actinoplanes tereljensis]GIF21787.1 anti-anti-sigma factor [Actinoplanes tereljensis]